MMSKPTLIALLLAIVAAPAPALAQAVPEKADVCGACHGENGVPADPAIPNIWGQHQGYLYLQLRDYKRGARKDEQMQPVAEELERDEMMALAAYFAKKPWPDLGQPAAPADVAAKARRASGSLQCTVCHLGEFQGDATVGRLAGQTRDYLLKTMLDFRNKVRENNPGMVTLMRATSEEDIAALAEYLSGLKLR